MVVADRQGRCSSTSGCFDGGVVAALDQWALDPCPGTDGLAAVVILGAEVRVATAEANLATAKVS